MYKTDHLGSISLHGDNHWYRNYDDFFNPQMQEHDVLYHNIGHSIEEAKKADIIILGHSMVLYSMRYDMIEKFAEKHQIRIYNLATAGDASGEFIRRVIKKWDLHPKLWIINADDHAAPFFSKSMQDFANVGKASAERVVSYSRFQAYLNVLGRNTLWRVSEFLKKYCFILSAEYSPLKKNFQNEVRIWRNIKTGNWYIDEISFYYTPGLPISVLRDKDCHADPAELAYAPSYIKDIGSNSLLILIPHKGYCPTRLKELASALKLESLIFMADKKYTTWDQSHMNRDGAMAFTKDFLDRLEKSAAFKKVLKSVSEKYG